MRIGCLQFSPHVGDINNNLNRADAVLSKASNLEELDLLVLPELAFTGYNFPSLAEIAPYLEPSGSGVSALWARTIALKYNCNVVVGYPEKVDVAQKWPTSPEYYNSAIMISPDGETIANYRKTFLFATDEKWALEGQEGFFEGHVPGLGTVAIGICMDLNPYKFEAPWHAFEFAFHVLHAGANLVIITMAWLTNEKARSYTRMPQEPDLEVLDYWVQRLEPLIRNDSDEEIIVVFCNRTGIEAEAVYAGTSAVVGILHGEVNLYGVLGRGVKELLVVDTDKEPFAKLVKPGIHETVTVERSGDQQQTAQQQSSAGSNSTLNPTVLSPPPQPDASAEDPQQTRSPASTEASGGSWEFMSDTASASPVSMMMPKPPSMPPRSLQPKLELIIPDTSVVAASFLTWKALGGVGRITPGGAADNVPTPTGPSPTPMSLRPKFVFPVTGSTLPVTREMIPTSVNLRGGASIVKVDRADTPITPPVRAGTRKKLQKPASISEGPPSPPTDDRLGFSVPKTNPVRAVGVANTRQSNASNASAKDSSRRGALNPFSASSEATPLVYDAVSGHTEISPGTDSGNGGDISGDGNDDDEEADSPFETPSETQESLLKSVQRELARLMPAREVDAPANPAAATAADTNYDSSDNFVPARPPSTKSRNASCPRVPESGTPKTVFGRSLSQSRMSIPVMASPSLFRHEAPSNGRPAESPIYFRPDGNFSNRTVQSGHNRPASETRDGRFQSRPTKKRADSPAVRTGLGMPSSRGAVDYSHTAGTAIADQPVTRPVSRGRQPFSKTNPTNGGDVDGQQQQRSVYGNGTYEGEISRGRQMSSNRVSGSVDRSFASYSALRNQAVSTTSTVSWLFGTPPPRTNPPLDPGDEIVAMINLVNRGCPVHTPILSGSVPPTQNQQGLRQQWEQQQEQQPQRRQQQQQQQQENEEPVSPEGVPFIDDSIYEVILPPHLRELVESSSPEPRLQSSLRPFDYFKGRGTPKFDPPTPTAMQFVATQDTKMPAPV